MSLDPEVRQLLEPLWDYWAVSEPLRATDVIFVFGSRDLALPARAAEFYHEGHARHVPVTGSYGRMTRDVFPKSEALVFKDHLVSAGVPPSAVLTESDASNTLENVRLGMEMMRRASRLPESALLVAKGFVMRRCVATFSQQFARTEVRACPPRTGLTEAPTGARPRLRYGLSPRSTGWTGMQRWATFSDRMCQSRFARRPCGSGSGSCPEGGDDDPTEDRGS